MEFRRVLFRSRTVAPQAIGRKNTRMQGKRHEEPESPRIARLGQPVCWTGGHASEFRSQADVDGAATTTSGNAAGRERGGQVGEVPDVAAPLKKKATQK